MSEANTSINLPRFEGYSLQEAVEWVQLVRESLDNEIIKVVQPIFQDELTQKMRDQKQSVTQLSSWANRVLSDLQLSLATEPDHSPAAFYGKRSRPTDPGRLYINAYQREGEAKRDCIRFDESRPLLLRSRHPGARTPSHSR